MVPPEPPTSSWPLNVPRERQPVVVPVPPDQEWETSSPVQAMVIPEPVQVLLGVFEVLDAIGVAGDT